MARGKTGLPAQMLLRISQGEKESRPKTIAIAAPINDSFKRDFSTVKSAATTAAIGNAIRTNGAAVYLTPAARPAIAPATLMSRITLVRERRARMNHAAASDS